MKDYVFNYYKDFNCIADACKHTCCAGWNILIDNKTLKGYKKNKSQFKTALCQGIDFKNKQFRLDENKRCVFLNKNNLCEIIINESKSSLCQVCRDHPRFRTFLKGRVEMGLGLTCEEACRIILTNKDKMSLIPVDSKKERLSKLDKELLIFRKDILDVLQDRSIKIIDRLNNVLGKNNLTIKDEQLNEFLTFIKGLEILDLDWQNKINSVDVLNYPEIENELVFEQLLCYFVYRHVCNCLGEFGPKIGLIFSILSALYIASFANKLSLSILEVARAYSSEIEYSNQNLQSVFDYIERNHRLGKI